MKATLCLSLLVGAAGLSLNRQAPDTTCGKGYEGLVPGLKDWFKTAQETLWTHPNQGGQKDWLQVWKMFSPAEQTMYRDNFPSDPLEEGSEIHYKQAIETANTLNKREIMCMSLFFIDDDCGLSGQTHIRIHRDGF